MRPALDVLQTAANSVVYVTRLTYTGIVVVVKRRTRYAYLHLPAVAATGTYILEQVGPAAGPI